jgi:hypothetical protein
MVRPFKKPVTTTTHYMVFLRPPDEIEANVLDPIGD